MRELAKDFGISVTFHSFRQELSYSAFLHTHTGGCESDLPPGRNREHLERTVENPAYTTCDAASGVSRDAWRFALTCENLRTPVTFISSQQFITAQTPLRPRVITGTFGYQF